MSQEMIINLVNEVTEGGFADTGICFLVNIKFEANIQFNIQLSLFLFGETGCIWTVNSSSHILERDLNHKFRQKQCPVPFII